MNDTEFHRTADALLQDIEAKLDDYDGDADIDCETNGGVMTLSFENGSKLSSTSRKHFIRSGWRHVTAAIILI